MISCFSINAWFKRIRGSSLEHGYTLHGASSEYVARLIFADFPTSMLVDGINEVVSGICVHLVNFLHHNKVWL